MFVRHVGCGVGHLDLRAPTTEQIMLDGFDPQGSWTNPLGNASDQGAESENDDGLGMEDDAEDEMAARSEVALMEPLAEL